MLPTASRWTMNLKEHKNMISLREDDSGRHAKNVLIYGCWEGKQYSDIPFWWWWWWGGGEGHGNVVERARF